MYYMTVREQWVENWNNKTITIYTSQEILRLYLERNGEYKKKRQEKNKVKRNGRARRKGKREGNNVRKGTEAHLEETTRHMTKRGENNKFFKVIQDSKTRSS